MTGYLRLLVNSWLFLFFRHLTLDGPLSEGWSSVLPRTQGMALLISLTAKHSLVKSCHPFAMRPVEQPVSRVHSRGAGSLEGSAIGENSAHCKKKGWRIRGASPARAHCDRIHHENETQKCYISVASTSRNESAIFLALLASMAFRRSSISLCLAAFFLSRCL